ncbi:uncharacterized protein LOC119594374 [Penaeus monodon]|uniref:uncharacterized protein LOC119594374 n=1 Tax=Penaeus monodon TaxID=6687 RepID=UPI0018A707F6|nr:uncharacterized protein LOC119594374 [Penaeus monodon]
MVDREGLDGLQHPSHTLHHPTPTEAPHYAHPVLVTLYLVGIVLCMVMAYFLDTSRRSTKGQRQAPPSDDLHPDSGAAKELIREPGEWVRPLGSLELFMAVGGEYGSLNTVLGLWLSSREPIRPENVRRALSVIARKNHMLQMSVVWRGTRPWFRRMEEVVVDFGVEDKEVMSVYSAELHAPYDMSRGPLWRARLVPMPEESRDGLHKAALLISVHHCITDGVTNVVLGRDLMRVLNASMMGTADDVPFRAVIPALPDALFKRYDWIYVFKYFWKKLFDTFIRNYNQKLYFKGILPQPETRFATTKVIMDEFSAEATQRLVQQCRDAGVTVHACIVAIANIAIFRVAQQRAKGRIDSALINTVNCINMRRYFPPENKESLGCHISLEETELLIQSADFTDKDSFWALVKRIYDDLQDSLNVHHTPAKNSPLFRPSSLIFHINYELTRRARQNRTHSHMITTNMGNLQHLLPGKYGDGPVEITRILRSVSSALTGHGCTLTFQTFVGRFMISLDYYSNKMTDDVAQQFFTNLNTYILNLTKYGCLNVANSEAAVWPSLAT